MASFEDNTHVFIVRVWLERREIEGVAADWRGMVEHVPSGERRYLKDLDDLAVIISGYLEGMGAELKLGWRVRRWLKQRKLFWKKQN